MSHDREACCAYAWLFAARVDLIMRSDTMLEAYRKVSLDHTLTRQAMPSRLMVEFMCARCGIVDRVGGGGSRVI